MDYVPHSEADISSILKEMNIGDIEDLYSSVPEKIKIKSRRLERGLSEFELKALIRKKAEKNLAVTEIKSFMGGGAYEHFIPAVVDHIAMKPEFYTAYTPYQPEASQGALQVIYEYQSLICELTGMDASNASLYDGATAAAEAALMSINKDGPGDVLISAAVNPEYVEVIKTYLKGTNGRILMVPSPEGVTSVEFLKGLSAKKPVCFIFQSPNYYGCIEDVENLSEIAHSFAALSIAIVNPVSLGVLKSPGSMGADIVVGEGQPLGIPLSYGGPYLGFMAVKKKFIRKLPGRIVGRTTDKEGNPGFVLTLQTREQHIRREKANSNICSNQALMALRATVFMTYMGKEGMKTLAEANINNSHYLSKSIEKTGKAHLKFKRPFFNEFVLEFKKPANLVFDKFVNKNMFPGILLKGEMDKRILCCVTETKTKADLDGFIEIIKDL